MKKILSAIIIVLLIYGCTSKTESIDEPTFIDTTSAAPVDTLAIDYPDSIIIRPNSIPSYIIITNPYSFSVQVEISLNPPHWQTETLQSYDKAEFSASYLFARICSDKTDCNTYKLVRGENYFVQYNSSNKWFIASADRD